MAHKIISLIILPVMILSFTGASFHLHVCSQTGDVYSDIHLIKHQNEKQDPACCFDNDTDNEGKQNRCSGEDKEQNHYSEVSCSKKQGTDHACCFDLEKKFETDNDYKYSHYNYRLVPAEVISILPELTDKEVLQLKEKIYFDSNSCISPPKLHSSVVLLL